MLVGHGARRSPRGRGRRGARPCAESTSAQEQEELVAAEAGDEVAVADGALAAPRRSALSASSPRAWPRSSLTCLKPSRSIATTPRLPPCVDDALDLGAQLLVQAAVVRQAGQRVGRGELLEALALVAQEGDDAVEAVGEVAELARAGGVDAGVEVALLEAEQARVQRARAA